MEAVPLELPLVAAALQAAELAEALHLPVPPLAVVPAGGQLAPLSLQLQHPVARAQSVIEVPLVRGAIRPYLPTGAMAPTILKLPDVANAGAVVVAAAAVHGVQPPLAHVEVAALPEADAHAVPGVLRKLAVVLLARGHEHDAPALALGCLAPHVHAALVEAVRVAKLRPFALLDALLQLGRVSVPLLLVREQGVGVLCTEPEQV
mmetsp:Transcript_42141/g.131135  ORF Transcript_42141/g.131135 Transcript_42141/m.131135 type:complete len:205 (+) Transcript_42141:34-648(+)